jgi:hypothetical protein
MARASPDVAVDDHGLIGHATLLSLWQQTWPDPRGTRSEALADLFPLLLLNTHIASQPLAPSLVQQGLSYHAASIETNTFGADHFQALRRLMHHDLVAYRL